MTLHRIFDLTVDSAVPLRGLPAVHNGEPDWRVGLLAKPIAEEDCDWVLAGRDDAGDETMACGRTETGYAIKFNDMAHFHIDFGTRSIDAWSSSACSPDTLAHLLIDQVLPRATCHLGRVVLHASAIVLSEGKAIAFAGESGAGKSTLATAYYLQGHEVMTDDCLLLEYRQSSVYVLPSYPSLRLWTDSVRAVMGESDREGVPFSDVAHYTHKKQLLLAQNGPVANNGCIELERIYVLEEQAERQGDAVEVAPAGGMSSIMALVNAMFTLDTEDKAVIERNFEAVGQIAGEIAIRHLRYPRDYRVLPEVMAAVMRDVSGNVMDDGRILPG